MSRRSQPLSLTLSALAALAGLSAAGCLAANDGAADLDPNDPIDPTDPAGPFNPTDPTDPSNPTDPADPIDPTDPVDPTDPALPPRPDRPAVCAPLVAELSLPGSYAGVLRGKNVFSSMTCGWGSGGPEEHLALTVHARTGVIITTPYKPGDISALVGIRTACDDQSTERWCSNTSTTTGVSTQLRAVLEPGHYEVVVDQHDNSWPPRWGGPYSLRVEPFDAAPNATCAAALPLTPGILRGQDLRQGAYAPNWQCAWSQRASLYYEVTVPPGAMTEVVALPAPGDGGVMMQGLASCGDTLVAACEQHDLAAEGQPLRVANTGSAPMRAVVAVFAAGDDALPRFDLVVSEHPLADHAACQAPRPVSLADGVRGDDLAFGSSQADGSPCTNGRTLFYEVPLPPYTRVTPSITVTRPTDAHVVPAYPYFQTGCGGDAATCSADPMEVVNATGAPTTALLGVSSFALGSATFDLDFATAPVAPNATCETATPLAVGTPVTADSTLGGGRDQVCGAYFSGRSLFWEVVVPAGAQVELVADPLDHVATFGAFVSARPACDGFECVFPDNFFAEGASVLRLDNRHGAEDETWIANAFVVDFHVDDPTRDLRFTLTARLIGE